MSKGNQSIINIKIIKLFLKAEKFDLTPEKLTKQTQNTIKLF